MKNSEINFGIVNFDFIRFFPHKFWISNSATDETYPDGFCYKILSVHDKIEGKIELVLIRAQTNGTKEELHRTRISSTQLDDAAHVFIDGLTQKFNLNFEEQDYTAAQTLEEFHHLTNKFGWSMRRLEA